MKALLGFVVVLVVLLAATPAALERWVDAQVAEVGAARAALAMEKAKQAAIETEALRRQADLEARVAAISAAHRIELILAWQSIEFVFVLALAGLLSLVDAELQRRFGLLAAHDADNFRAVGLAPLLLVIDELSIVAQNREALTAVTNLARLGRAAGVLTIAATQRPAAASVSGDLRALADWTLVFAVERRGEALICGAPGAELLPRRPGRGLFRRGATVELQAYACQGWRAMMRALPAAIEEPAPVRIAAAPGSCEGPAPEHIETKRERILRLHANGMSLSAIAWEVYGTVGGAAFYQVKAVLAEADTAAGE